MTKREVGSLAFKLAGIYAIVQAIPQMHAVTFYLSGIGADTQAQSWLFPVMAAAPLALMAALGCLLLAYSNRLSARMFGEAAEDVSFGASGKELQAIAFSVVGVCFLVSALPRLLHILMYQHRGLFNAEVRRQISLSAWASLVGTSAQMAIGIALFFGSKGLSKLWHKLRAAGHPQSSEGESS